MNRYLVSAFLLASGLPAGAEAAGAPADVRLVLQITVDQLRGDLPGRVLDRLEPGGLRYLHEHGVHYTNAYSATPTCIPARRGLMTGTTARTHGDRIFNETLSMPDLPVLAQTFS